MANEASAVSHVFVTAGIDASKVEADARERVTRGESVLIHYHSGREPCFWMQPPKDQEHRLYTETEGSPIVPKSEP